MNAIKLIDCFPYNGESIVSHRLEKMAKYVDIIYVIESWYTHSGNKKDFLYIEKNADVFKPYLDKIIFLVIPEFPPMPEEWRKSHENSSWMKDLASWWNESYQRNYVFSELKKMSNINNFNFRYILIVSDVDEILNDNVMLSLNPSSYNEIGSDPVFLEMDFFYYSWSWKKKYKWYHAFIMTDMLAKKDTDVSKIRVDVEKRRICPNAGWHLSYFMPADELVRKLSSFAHRECDQDGFRKKEWIEECLATGKDLYKRGEYEDCVRND